jgi:hypothetical protein
MQMAGKEEIKPGLEKPGLEESGSSRIRITLTSQEVKPLEKGMCQIHLLWYYSQTSGHLSVIFASKLIPEAEEGTYKGMLTSLASYVWPLAIHGCHIWLAMFACCLDLCVIRQAPAACRCTRR